MENVRTTKLDMLYCTLKKAVEWKVALINTGKQTNKITKSTVEEFLALKTKERLFRQD